MSLVLDETSIRTSRPGLTQANGSRSLERLLGRHGRRDIAGMCGNLYNNIIFICVCLSVCLCVRLELAKPIKQRNSAGSNYA